MNLIITALNIKVLNIPQCFQGEVRVAAGFLKTMHPLLELQRHLPRLVFF